MVVVRERKCQIPPESPIQRKVRSKFYVVLKVGRNIKIAKLSDWGIPAKSTVCNTEQETREAVTGGFAHRIVNRIRSRDSIKIQGAGAGYALLVILRGAANVDAKVDVVAATRVQ